MPAVSTSDNLNARVPYTMMKMPSKMKISDSITETQSLVAMAIFGKNVLKVLGTECYLEWDVVCVVLCNMRLIYIQKI
jgi:hypothetical protein